MTLLIGAGVFVITFCSGLLGLALNRALPESHRSDQSKDVVRLVQAFIASIATLVLSLLIASANDHYQEQAEGATTLAADMIVLDGALAHAGPGAAAARDALRGMLRVAIESRLLESRTASGVIDPTQMDAFYNAVAALPVGNAAQHAAQLQALSLAGRLVQARATLLVRDAADRMQWPFLAVLVAWISVMFLAMGLFVRVNTMIVLALGVGGLAVSGAIFLILELEQPHSGLLHISDRPLRFALQEISR